MIWTELFLYNSNLLQLSRFELQQETDILMFVIYFYIKILYFVKNFSHTKWCFGYLNRSCKGILNNYFSGSYPFINLKRDAFKSFMLHMWKDFISGWVYLRLLNSGRIRCFRLICTSTGQPFDWNEHTIDGQLRVGLSVLDRDIYEFTWPLAPMPRTYYWGLSLLIAWQGTRTIFLSLTLSSPGGLLEYL